ncbi:MAG: hypothetical protein QGH45_17450 [Myxococcota bacterium]|nr:hypothetical protein [Myxococcota bacterium]
MQRTDDDDDGSFDVEFWLRIPPEERAAAAWQLSLELWSLAEPDVDHERRLSRHVARVVRG